MKEFFAELFKFIKELMPAIATFFMGKRVGELGKEEIRAKRDALKLELERVRNAQLVDKANANKSDSELIDAMVRAGLDKVPKSD